MKRKPLWKRRRWSVARLIALLAGVQPGATLDTLRKRYGVTTRDLVSLEKRLMDASEDGIPILSMESSPGIRAKAVIAKRLKEMASLDVSETLWAVRALAAGYGGPKYDKALKSIAAELTKGKWKGDYERFGRFYPDQSPPLLPPEGRLVIDALQENKILGFRYEGADPEKRRVQPVSFRRDHNRWRLLAWDTQRGDWRVFRLDTMKDVKVSGETFVWPKRVDAAKMRSMDLGVFRPAGGEKQVKIKIRKPAWERYQGMFPLSRPPAKGWVTLTLPSNSPEWVARHFLPALGDVRILGPEKFRQAWLAEVESVKKIY